MIHAQQVKHAVQHQDADLVADSVAVLGCLLFGPLEGDGYVAEGIIRFHCRKR